MQMGQVSCSDPLIAEMFVSQLKKNHGKPWFSADFWTSQKQLEEHIILLSSCFFLTGLLKRLFGLPLLLFRRLFVITT